MHFADPAWLHALWGVLLLALLLRAARRRRQRALERLLAAEALPRNATRRQPAVPARRMAIWLAALAFLALALARPQWGFRWEEVHRRGVDVLILLDTSRSMLATDVRPDRLQQARWGIRDFVRALRGDRVGLVAFAGASFLQCPLTTDYAAFLMTLDDVRVGSVPLGGTAIRRALDTALDTFLKQATGERVVLLITDGEDHEGNPLALVEALREEEVRVYAIGVGTPDGELLPAPEGAAGFQKDAAGHVIKSSLREDVLARLAAETGGVYVRAAPGDLGLEKLHREHLAQLARDESDTRRFKRWEDRAGWFLGAALLLLAVEAVLGLQRPGAKL